MLRKILLINFLFVFILAACTTGATPTVAPAAPTEAMSEEAMPEDEMMEDVAMDDESMADESMDEESMESEDMMDEAMKTAEFSVRIENLSPAYDFLASGVFNTPAGADAPGPLASGAAYEFGFNASPGMNLSFATMFVQSNDLFYAPEESGIALFQGGEPLSGDITELVFLWDAGTEVNQQPGVGLDQAPRQGGMDTGETENGLVQIVADGFEYPQNVIRVTITRESSG